MNPLLKRQIKKYLPEEFKNNLDLKVFLDAVNSSYETSDKKLIKLQTVATLSSDELFETNKRLKEETKSQKKLINRLNDIINSLKENNVDNNNINSEDSVFLVDFVEKQTMKLLKVDKQKDKLLKSLEKQNQELNDYVHMVSHDLKSPLQSIDALTSWLAQDFSEELGENGLEVVHHIRENVEKMDSLIKGILEYSTVGKIEKKPYPVNLNNILEQIQHNIHNPYNIPIKVKDRLPTIIGDHYRLELLFTHLIENAIKFNGKKEEGLVKVNFEEKEEYWEFSVSDNGKGFDKKYSDKIFVAFQKLENDYKSTGIGLSIVKKIIEAYEGVISVESFPNIETTFTFTIKKNDRRT